MHELPILEWGGGGRASRQWWRWRPVSVARRPGRRGTMALSLSADDDEYDSEAEQVRGSGVRLCVALLLSL